MLEKFFFILNLESYPSGLLLVRNVVLPNICKCIFLFLNHFNLMVNFNVIGDTFPVGCAFDKSIVYHKVFPQKKLVN
jgi:hypothetical protein